MALSVAEGLTEYVQASAAAPIDPLEGGGLRPPRRIQGFGCLVAVDEAGTIVGFSANTASMLRREPSLGQALTVFLASDERSVERLLAVANATPEPTPLPSDMAPADLRKRFDVLTHASSSGVVLEFIPHEHDRPLAALSPVRDAENVFRQCFARAERISALTGYDRVMVYRFNEDFTGEVIAEVRRPEVVPYLGLRYPESDIPSNTRALYLENRSRIIPNVYAPTSTLISSKTIDLRKAKLRGVSSYQIEFLQNLQVSAILTFSLIVDGALWGLVICHHAKVRALSYVLQKAALGEVDALSASIAASRRREAEAALGVARRQEFKWNDLLTGTAIAAPLLSGAQSIVSELGADGGALVCGDACLSLGAAPDCEWLRAFVKQFETVDGAFSTDKLSEREGLEETTAAAGAMSARVGSDPPVTLFVFRRALNQEIHWAGDPRAAAAVSLKDNKPAPRQSFALWRELVRDRAQAWTSRERNAFDGCLVALSARMREAVGAGSLLRDELWAVATSNADVADANRLLGGALPEGVAVLLWTVRGGNARVHYANRAFTILFGLQSVDIIGHDPAHIFERTQVDRALLDYADGEEQEIVVWAPTLGVRRVRARRETLMRYHGSAGDIAVDSLVLLDTTNASRSQDALLSAVRQAEAAEGARGALLRNMSHELRTPLNAVVGYSDMLAQELVGPLGDPSYVSAAREIRHAAGHLLQLINNTLEVARLKSGKAQIDPSRHDLGEIVFSAMRLVRKFATSRRIELTDHLPAAPVYATVDEMAFRQIVINLANNAIKFTMEGGKVDVFLSHEDDGSAVLSVADTGIGIASQEVDRLFTPFAQVDSRISRPRGGSGLGLAIVKELIQLHGGKIELESVEGVGSTFTVRLPAWRVETNE